MSESKSSDNTQKVKEIKSKKEKSLSNKIINWLLLAVILSMDALIIQEIFPSGIMEKLKVSDAIDRDLQNNEDEQDRLHYELPRGLRDGIYPVAFSSGGIDDDPDLGMGTSIYLSTVADQSIISIPYHPDDAQSHYQLSEVQTLFFTNPKTGEITPVTINKCKMVDQLVEGYENINLALCAVNTLDLPTTFSPVDKSSFNTDSNWGYDNSDQYISISSPVTETHDYENRTLYYAYTTPTSITSDGVITHSDMLVTDGSSGGVIVDVSGDSAVIRSIIEGSKPLDLASLLDDDTDIKNKSIVRTRAFLNDEELQKAITKLLEK